MKKLISILIIVSVSIHNLMAKDSRHETGNISVNAGVGISGGFSFTKVPPLKVDADYTFLTFGSASLSAGAYMSLAKYESFNYIMAGPMATFRFALSNHFEVFAKSIIGYKQISSAKHIGYGGYAGVTWYFSSILGIGTEIGYGGPTLAGFHVTLKF